LVRLEFSNLDDELFDGAGATKRDLVNYLDGVADRIVPILRDRALSVIRVHSGGSPFMQKNLPKSTPDFVRRVTFWAETSKRDVTYAVCDSRDTLLWFANQRAVEYHPSLTTLDHPDRISHLVIDLDPPPDAGFDLVVRVARLVESTLAEISLRGVVKTSGAKGLHVFVPIEVDIDPADAAGALRAIAVRVAALDPAIATTEFMKEDRGGRVFVDATRAGGATVVSTYSPRARPGVPVSFPVAWNDLEAVNPRDFTITTALDGLGGPSGADPWADNMPEPQALPADVVAEGKDIPGGRVEAMHEGKRRRRTS
jgi:bifunctional non-homologous end joining protein LigD